MNDKPRAFALELCKQDISLAEQFGEIVYLFERLGDRCSIWSEDFPSEVIRALSKHRFDPNKDYFIVAGQMVPLTIATAMMASRYGAFNGLLYSSSERRYIERILGA